MAGRMPAILLYEPDTGQVRSANLRSSSWRLTFSSTIPGESEPLSSGRDQTLLAWSAKRFTARGLREGGDALKPQTVITVCVRQPRINAGGRSAGRWRGPVRKLPAVALSAVPFTKPEGPLAANC